MSSIHKLLTRLNTFRFGLIRTTAVKCFVFEQLLNSTELNSTSETNRATAAAVKPAWNYSRTTLETGLTDCSEGNIRLNSSSSTIRRGSNQILSILINTGIKYEPPDSFNPSINRTM